MNVGLSAKEKARLQRARNLGARHSAVDQVMEQLATADAAGTQPAKLERPTR